MIIPGILPELLVFSYRMGKQSNIIAAIASGEGAGAIGVVRLSGSGSHWLSLRMCRDLDSVPRARRLNLTGLVHPSTGAQLDLAMVVFFEEGSSYTGEESVEFHCHGGRVVLDRVLGACMDADARPAGPGEFTRRALTNGRLDLAQAEAIALLSRASTEEAADVALAALQGRCSEEVASLREMLMEQLCDSEAALDFTEDDCVEFDARSASKAMGDAVRRMDDWLDSARAARPMLYGVRAAIVGPPNAGKSSLFNAVVGQSRAIVHDEPGTTRDVVSEAMTLGGSLCLLMDTAGLRVSGGTVEAEGVTRALQAARDADICILAIDGSDDGCGAWLDRWMGADLEYGIVALTKADLWDETLDIDGLPADISTIRTSAADGTGIQELIERLGEGVRACMRRGRAAECVIAGERQVETVCAARDHVQGALQGMEGDAPLEVTASELRAAVESLDEVTGRRVTEEVLDRIFRRFCIGK